MEEPTRHRPETAELYEALGHAALMMLARPSCFSIRPVSSPVPVQFGPCALVGERSLS
jgi:hypothetical protein